MTIRHKVRRLEIELCLDAQTLAALNQGDAVRLVIDGGDFIYDIYPPGKWPKHHDEARAQEDAIKEANRAIRGNDAAG